MCHGRPRRAGRFTLNFEASIVLLQQCRTVRGAARLARITEDADDGVMRLAVERALLRRQLKQPILLEFDGKATRKGQRYAIILTDVENGCVIDLIEERTTEAALQFLGQLPEGSSESI